VVPAVSATVRDLHEGWVQWTSTLASLGFAVAIAYFLVVTPLFAEVREVVLLVAGIGGVILAPIWYIWLGLMLRRTEVLQYVRLLFC
jgi:hypothetical protein